VRTAIYARHSTEKQTNSTQDQIARCEKFCEAKKYTVIDVYYDAAFSGSHMGNRPGISSLLMSAFNNRFDRVVCEDLSRISRDQGDVANFFKKMAFVGIELETVAEGIINELHIGLKGTMNALYLKDLSDKTYRGMVASVLRGGVPGGRTYGYENVRDLDPNGEIIRGKRRIVEEEANIVREIFDMYNRGEKLKHICEVLDARAIKAPNGGRWNPTTLVGVRARKTGLLRNTLYSGIVTFNRQQYRKHPETGRKLPILRPQSEWIRVPIPELQIIGDELFDAVQKMLDDRSSKAAEYKLMVKMRQPEETKEQLDRLNRNSRERQIKAKERVFGVFSGRLRCVEHGTKIGAHWADRYSCVHETCPHRSVRYSELADVVLRQASRLTTQDICNWFDSEQVCLKRDRINERINAAEKKVQNLRNRAEHILNSLELSAANVWLEDNAEAISKERLKIDKEKRNLAEITVPDSKTLRIIHSRFIVLIDKLLEWSRAPEAVQPLRHIMKLYHIHAHWDEAGQRWYRSCDIEYDFPAMVRILGSQNKK
jgi:DNA invertase Pin-like site-specific DNA recombinase